VSSPIPTVYTVSEISAAVKRVVTSGFRSVRVRGEISGYRGPHSSGHVYFAMKDETAKIDAVIWRSVLPKLRFPVEEGMEVEITGSISTFASNSKYQIHVETLEPAGVGALASILENRRKKLEQEGLFLPERKLKLPFLPKVIGVITSASGVVIQDIRHRLSDRCPVRVLLWSVTVQGSTSACEVSEAITGFNELPSGKGQDIPKPDLLIIARGGGSLEDLWSFNEEIVVRAAAASTIPIISAIGHETDWTLLDLVADCRAPTPTGAAELAVPVHEDLVKRTSELDSRIQEGMSRHLSRSKQACIIAARLFPSPEGALESFQQRFDVMDARLSVGSIVIDLCRLSSNLTSVASRLSPNTISNVIALYRERASSSLSRIQRAVFIVLLRYQEQRLPEMWMRLHAQCPSQHISRGWERTHTTGDQLETAMREFVSDKESYMASRLELLESVSYTRVLRRGFVMAQSSTDEPISSVSSVTTGDVLTLHFHDGTVPALVQDVIESPACK